MRLSEFDYYLPQKFIAQEPLLRRDGCRLLIVDRQDKSKQEVVFKDIVRFFKKGDVLVLNDTRVLPARLYAQRKTGGKLEVLLLKPKGSGMWEVLVKPGKRARVGEDIVFTDGKLTAKILDRTASGGRVLKFHPSNIKGLIKEYGKMPLPHYIKKELQLPGYYQTVYARYDGAVAAPTAGLHFTRRLLRKLQSQGVDIVYITLHCGLATFRPVKAKDIRQHQMDSELYRIDANAARKINKAKSEGRSVIAVGTTAARALEAAVVMNRQGIYQVGVRKEEASLYIYPGYKFKIVDIFLTNFHLPRSTNLILISAFAGIELIRSAYQYAIKKRFRFYSFGDAMLIK